MEIRRDCTFEDERTTDGNVNIVMLESAKQDSQKKVSGEGFLEQDDHFDVGDSPMESQLAVGGGGKCITNINLQHNCSNLAKKRRRRKDKYNL